MCLSLYSSRDSSGFVDNTTVGCWSQVLLHLGIIKYFSQSVSRLSVNRLGWWISGMADWTSRIEALIKNNLNRNGTYILFDKSDISIGIWGNNLLQSWFLESFQFDGPLKRIFIGDGYELLFYQIIGKCNRNPNDFFNCISILIVCDCVINRTFFVKRSFLLPFHTEMDLVKCNSTQRLVLNKQLGHLPYWIDGQFFKVVFEENIFGVSY